MGILNDLNNIIYLINILVNLNQMHRVEDYKIAKKKSFDLKENIFSFFYRIGFNIISIYNNDDRKAFVWIKINSIYIRKICNS